MFSLDYAYFHETLGSLAIASRALGAYALRQTIEVAGRPLPLGEVSLDKFSPMQMELVINALRDRGGQKMKQCPEGRPLLRRLHAT